MSFKSVVDKCRLFGRAFARARQRQALRSVMHNMSDHQLLDIGLDRTMIDDAIIRGRPLKRTPNKKGV